MEIFQLFPGKQKFIAKSSDSNASSSESFFAATWDGDVITWATGDQWKRVGRGKKGGSTLNRFLKKGVNMLSSHAPASTDKASGHDIEMKERGAETTKSNRKGFSAAASETAEAPTPNVGVAQSPKQQSASSPTSSSSAFWPSHTEQAAGAEQNDGVDHIEIRRRRSRHQEALNRKDWERRWSAHEDQLEAWELAVNQTQKQGDRPGDAESSPNLLPPDWVMKESTSKPGRFYYVNTVTNERSWSKPDQQVGAAVSGAAVAGSIEELSASNTIPGLEHDGHNHGKRRSMDLVGDLRTKVEPVLPETEEETNELKSFHSKIRWHRDDDFYSIVRQNPRLLNLSDPQTGNTALHLAVQNGHDDFTDVILR